ncbi:MAG TPA: hypothetical protein VN036_11570, partial [Devosia sp.]|nr:hypothetical protein [Devosia sp.]
LCAARCLSDARSTAFCPASIESASVRPDGRTGMVPGAWVRGRGFWLQSCKQNWQNLFFAGLASFLSLKKQDHRAGQLFDMVVCVM